jgi:tetratricopeptide (TPR) repeat protein
MQSVNEKEKSGKGSSGKGNSIDGINEFVQKNRKPIFTSLIVILLALVAFVLSVSILDALRNKAIARVDELNRRYEALRFDITVPEKEEDVQALLADLTAFAEKTSGFPGGRAWSIIAGINADRKEWAEAEKAWTSAGTASVKTYLAPVSFFNAAAAAEEQGNTEAAIELYTKSVAQSSGFPAAARAQFSVGRLREAQNDTAAALEAYQAVVTGWPNDGVWTNLAHSRIIILGGESGSEAVSIDETEN